jgi:adenosylcobinamide-GDP ribazoletransferase
MVDSLRLALGTLTAVRVVPPRRLSPAVARGAMLLAPLVGALLGVVAALVLAGTQALAGIGGAPGPAAAPGVDLLGAALAVASLGLLTRGLHLDGLADTADALGVKALGDADGGRARRLEVMRRPEVGAFGVAALVLVVLVEVAALATCAASGTGTLACVVALAIGRLGALWCCTRGIPSARPEGLGALVAGTVPRSAAGCVAAVVLVAALAWSAMLASSLRTSAGVGAVVALLGAAAASAYLVRAARRAFGGITGDVLGAVVEVCTALALVALAVASA